MRKSKLLKLSIASLFFCGGIEANANTGNLDDLPTFDLELIAAAIRSEDGLAKGVARGATADTFKRETRSNEPIFATVRVLQRFQQFECARVQIEIVQDKVPTVDGGFIKFEMPVIGMNICTDGNPPDGTIEDLPKGNLQPSIDMLPK